MSEYISSKTVKTRKSHKCWGCTRTIPIGTEVNVTTSTDCGSIFDTYFCSDCEKYLSDHPWDFEDGIEYGGFLNDEEYKNKLFDKP